MYVAQNKEMLKKVIISGDWVEYQKTIKAAVEQVVELFIICFYFSTFKVLIILINCKYKKIKYIFYRFQRFSWSPTAGKLIAGGE